MKNAAYIAVRRSLAQFHFIKGLYHALQLLRFRVYNLILYGDAEVFGNICIETDSACNRKCPNCPVAYCPRPHERMSDEAFKGIIDQLAKKGYQGEITLHFYNEPLIDSRLVDLISLARNKCPKSYIYFATNGDFINEGLFRALLRAGLDYMFISCYDDALSPRLKSFLESLKESDKKYYKLRSVGNYCNRGGVLNGKEIAAPLDSPCGRPWFQMIVNTGGDVVVCCNDYFGQEKLGNVARENIFDIWKKQRMRYIRSRLRDGRRRDIPICARCDLAFGGYRFPMMRQRRYDTD